MATNTTKTPLQYEVVTMSMGEGKPVYNYPKLVNMRTLSEEALVKAAIEDGYAKGKYDEVLATFHGILRCMDRKLSDGYICLNEFFKAYLVLNGQVDENGGLTAENTIKTEFLSRKPIKQAMDNYSFSNVKTTASVTIANVSWNGSTVGGEIKKEENILATGTNLMFNADIGDKITFEYGGETIACSVDGSGYQMISVAWPAELSEAAVGTEVAFTFTLHGGKADVNPKVISKTAKIVG